METVRNVPNATFIFPTSMADDAAREKGWRWQSAQPDMGRVRLAMNPKEQRYDVDGLLIVPVSGTNYVMLVSASFTVRVDHVDEKKSDELYMRSFFWNNISRGCEVLSFEKEHVLAVR